MLPLEAAFSLYRLIFASSVDVLPNYGIGNPIILESRQVRFDLPGLIILVNRSFLLE
jgi:hypothetical protein